MYCLGLFGVCSVRVVRCVLFAALLLAVCNLFAVCCLLFVVCNLLLAALCVVVVCCFRTEMCCSRCTAFFLFVFLFVFLFFVCVVFGLLLSMCFF